MPSTTMSAVSYVAIASLLTSSFLVAAQPATSTQRCEPAGAVAISTERFVPQGDGTVVDTASGLQWRRCSEGQSWANGDCVGQAATYNWHQALEHAESVGYGGFDDWRLPALAELTSIVAPACINPAIELDVFPATPPFAYWSSTPFEHFIRLAWAVYFNSGSDGYSPKEYGYFHIRLVRDRGR